MAHLYNRYTHSPPHNQEYHPLDSLTPAYTASSSLRGDASQTTDYSVEDNRRISSSGDYIAKYDSSHGVPNSGEPVALYPSNSSTQKLSHTGITSSPPTNSARFSVSDWKWEIGASVFSLGCFAGVVGLLASYDTKSLASWNFVFGVTLNTLIAVLSTLSRTALMVPVASCLSQLKWIHLVSASRPLRDVQVFEDASRGPWGSFELIWRLHIKTKLATWGSFITILTLAMGPFAQQLVAYPSRFVLSDGAMYYTSHIYDSAYGQFRSTRGATGSITSTMGPKMQGAIVNGLFNLSSPIPFTCTTGNCQWDVFSTLAMTSNCQNVTSNTKVLCERVGGSFGCNYTTPSGFLINAYSHTSSGGGSYTNFNTTAFKPLSYGSDPMSDRDSPINSTLARIAMATMQGDFNISNPDVLECQMRLCARVTSNLTITNGTFIPGISEDIELEGVPGRYEAGLQPGIRGMRDWYTYNITGEHPSFPGNRSFSYNMIDMEGVKNFLYNVFTSSFGAGSGDDDDTSSLYYWPLMNSSDHAKTLVSISQSMSYAFAQAPSGEKLQGRAFSSELYIRVQWLWIILPLAEVFMSVAFLVCTMIYTQRSGVTAWKSSGIVPLLTVMVGWDSIDLRAGSSRDIEQRSKHMHGQMVPNAGDVQGFHRT